ncbi:MAG TPA: isochorismatase family protein [Conexibacter sp.]|nr:isochorismatase family protein [Conexibacter sp.]
MPHSGSGAGRLAARPAPAGPHGPVRPCLVVVDLSYGFTDPASPLACDAERAVAETATLLACARRHGRPCVFTTIGYDAGELDVAARFVEKLPALAGLTVGSRWVEIDARVAPAPGEPVLRKLFASAFFGVPLASLLAAHGCDALVLCGASTSGCVRATAVDAMQHGYRALVVRDAVADRAAAPAEAALFDVAAKYGDVVSTAEACAMLAGDAA